MVDATAAEPGLRDGERLPLAAQQRVVRHAHVFVVDERGVSVGTRNIDMPLYALTSGFVTAITMRNDAVFAFDEKNFHPLMTHSSPSFTAWVLNIVGSAPACGSVIE